VGQAGNQIEIQAALKSWRDGLVGLSKANRLIKFTAPKTSSVLVDSPDPDVVLARVASGTPQAFRGDLNLGDGSPAALPPGTSQILHSPRPDTELGPVLRNLMRKAQTEFLDRGLSVLYLAFGMLHWKDVDDTAMISPVLLVPVSLLPEGPKGVPRLTEGEDDAVINPALALRLKDFGIDLPHMDDLDGLTVTEVLTAVRTALTRAKDFTDWDLQATTYLSTFSFAKEAMFKDLHDNEEQILEHPIVRALATSDPAKQGSDFLFEPIDPADIERVAPPELTPLVLDADSSQRAAVAASLAGRTFVMDGPPGTGKSQTIANMIGALLHAGKTVLFVSEKMAALDVVRNRLSDAGLGNYLLELHSHKASRKEVATELLRSLDNLTQPPAGLDALSREAVRDRRERLNDYAGAMNEIRQPLNRSLHSVLGALAVLVDVPSAPQPDVDPAALSQADFIRVQEVSAQLERAWRPAAQGTSFLWRDATDESSLDIRLYQSQQALIQLQGSAELNADLMAAFGLTRPSDTAMLIALIAHQHEGHPAGALEPWLTTTGWDALTRSRTSLGEQIAGIRLAERAVLDRAGVEWSTLPAAGDLPASPAPLALNPSPVDMTILGHAELETTASAFQATAASLSERVGALSRLATSLGLHEVTTVADADRMIRLVDLRGQGRLLDRSWMTRQGLTDARTASVLLHEQTLALNAAEERATSVFTGEALKAPLMDLQNRFTNLHKGLRKLSGDYRADKKAVAALLTDATDVKEGIRRLSEAITWGETTRAYDAAAAHHAAALGAHWRKRDTDFEALNAALTTAEEIVHLLDGQVPPVLATYLCGPSSDDPYSTVAASARSTLADWRASLAPAPALSGRPDLLLGTIAEAVEWYQAHVEPMRQAAGRIAVVEAITGRTHTLAQANELLTLAESARNAHAALTEYEEDYRAAFGPYFAYADTDLIALDVALDWAERLRVLVGGPLTSGQVKALANSQPVEALPAAFEKWTSARDRILAAFASSRTAELSAEFDDYRLGLEFIDDLREDTVGQQEWFDYQRARAALSHHGLEAAVDFCIDQRVDAAIVPKVVARALLRGWADAVIHNDARLRPALASDRDALVAEYRSLDQQLVANAVADIIRAANTRRPANTSIGEPGVIRREGMKKRKHLPVRDLIGRTRTTSVSIKPVFMMSPLAVSQYLPSEMSFDVVIFDEASQVTPGDAINCIYRGQALILAGDDKQLPPTSFFERNEDDSDEEDTDVKDFQSVLELAKACGAFSNLGLRWHYRSRHEDLIAFSNYKFYDGKLVTYPSSHSEGDDVGVAYFNAHGTYRRGGGADNPGEARKVAERVIDHFTNRPDLTLGVVTFSVAQADAVVDAIDEARETRRDLDRYFDKEDRLDGFFVRSLESVQGDERDVIIFSVGYGPDEAGKITTNFGVLNKDRGWRRLNVGITRARQRVEVIASMTAGQIPPSSNENVEYLRNYLDYAERGTTVLAIPYSSTGLEPDSPFEESVIKTIQGWGFTVEPQVGAAGFRIDIGVRHPAHPGMFAIGIECDGHQYHSAPAARDRDRLRDQILAGLGWSLHRIWGTAWYRNRSREEDRLREAIEWAISRPHTGRHTKAPTIERPVIETVEADTSSIPSWTTEYVFAGHQKLPYWVDPGESGNHLHMVDPISALVQVEGPVHIEVIHERVRGWWNIGRVGANIRRNIDLAIQQAPVIRDSDFVDQANRTLDRVRTPGRHLVVRKAEHIHLDEIALAVELLVRDVGAADRSEVVQQVARIFGWARTGALVDRRVNDAVDRTVTSGRVRLDRERLVIDAGSLPHETN
jgi:hypothetical protein